MNPKQIIPVAAAAASTAGPAAPVVLGVIAGVAILVWLFSDDKKEKPEADSGDSIFDGTYFAPVLGSKPEESKIPAVSAGNTTGNHTIPPVSAGNSAPKQSIPAVSAGQSAVVSPVTRPAPVTPSSPVSTPVTTLPISVPPPVQVPTSAPAPVKVVTKNPVPAPAAPASEKFSSTISPPAPRKIIARAQMEKVFSGKLSLTRSAAVIALKNLGFGKSAAYDALLQDGRFAAWLKFAPDGTIIWKN